MDEKVSRKYLLLIVVLVASLAVVTLLSSVLTGSADVTGAAVREHIVTLCKDNDASNAENKIHIEQEKIKKISKGTSANTAVSGLCGQVIYQKEITSVM